MTADSAGATYSRQGKGTCVLLVSDSYPPIVGGAPRSTQLLARHLRRRGYEVAVATSWQQGAEEEEMMDGIPVHRLRAATHRLPFLSSDPYRCIPPPFPDPELVWRFRRLIRQIAPDLVHVYGWFAYSCVVALWRTKIPMTLSARSYENTCAVGTLVRKGSQCTGPSIRKCPGCAADFYGSATKGAMAFIGLSTGRWMLRRRLSGLHSVSQHVQNVMQEHLLGSIAGPIGDPQLDVVIPNFHDEAETTSVQTDILAQLPSEPFILYVGALRKVKGIAQLIEAHAEVERAPRLVLMGTPAPDTPDTFPEGVIVLQGATYATVMATWARASFGVAPSLLPEPLGNVVHEAMGAGRAMIGTFPGGHSDMIEDGVTGLLVPAGDVSRLAAAMRRLVDDRKLRESMGRAARTRASLFTAEAVMPSYEKLFARVLERSIDKDQARPRDVGSSEGRRP